MELKSVWPVVTLVVVYTGFIFGGFSWMLKAQITPIKELLNNHISDTNKKIDKLSDRVDKLSDRFDKQSDRFDKQSDRFDKLYDFLMQQQISQKSRPQQISKKADK